MKITETKLDGCIIIEPKVFPDGRGYFFESFRADKWTEAGLTEPFVQDNQSKSSNGVLRGLHFQKPPHAQGKLVRVIQGAILDIAVDIRIESATFGEHVAIELSGRNHLQLYVPAGFAHGFLTLEDDTIVNYKCTQCYHKDSEAGLMWNDPSLGIEWGITAPSLSEKDSDYLPWTDFTSPFVSR